MSGKGWAKKLLPKTDNRWNVDHFRLAGLDCLVLGKWLTDHMWGHCVNKNHTLSYSSLVDTAMLHHSVSNNNKIKTVVYKFITHQAVKIWWCTFTSKIHKNYKTALLLTNEKYFHGVNSVLWPMKFWIWKPVTTRHL